VLGPRERERARERQWKKKERHRTREWSIRVGVQMTSARSDTSAPQHSSAQTSLEYRPGSLVDVLEVCHEERKGHVQPRGVYQKPPYSHSKFHRQHCPRSSKHTRCAHCVTAARGSMQKHKLRTDTAARSACFSLVTEEVPVDKALSRAGTLRGTWARTGVPKVAAHDAWSRGWR